MRSSSSSASSAPSGPASASPWTSPGVSTAVSTGPSQPAALCMAGWQSGRSARRCPADPDPAANGARE
eukprot:1938323-Alexandrium_andersonii.AAC.1